MKPMELDEMPNDIFIQDIKELTESFSIDFPNVFRQLLTELNVSKDNLFITDFIENQKIANSYTGYVFDKTHKKMYDYTIKNKKLSFFEVDIKKLTTKDTDSIRVLDEL
ncbi:MULTISPECIES: hypothetical protein [unclassified Neisseria]|jgi:hypothetical protein|uniref:hypothetical protein n=1 Tax=unclassified Neisseria TaxID=2623750 RepID=UPI00022BF3FD|nr:MULTISPECIES: hypothetical protein [unclassified Neisseria]EGY62374.1 hypothetical protein HMPREF1028_00595 [Neisseria sp. GT4A_CT1]MDU1535403.1 hypothetical protein [Neisseria sp.]OFL98997.1 hypothetical protein HMPREF2726_00895 [Neisseria sp. HMSC074B07]